MNSPDSVSERVVLPAREFFVGLVWELAAEARLTPARIEGLQQSAAALLRQSLAEEAARVLVDLQQSPGDGLRVQVEARPLSWRTSPLEMTFAVMATPLAAAWADDPPLVDRSGSAALAESLRTALQGCAEGSGQAIASLSPPLQFVSAWTKAAAPTVARQGDGPVRAVDLEAVRSERVPVEYELLLDAVSAANSQLLTLADLLGIARAQSIDDEDVLGSLNFYIEKGYLAFDRTHQVVRLTAHGRAAAMNTLRDRGP